MGAVLGITGFVTRDKIGIELLRPVKTVAQQMSMLGKDSGATFNRPTTIELIVNPAYRIYYTGDEYTEQLLDYLKKEESVYTTYLGTAYALTKPVLYKEYDSVGMAGSLDAVETKTVVPTILIKDIFAVQAVICMNIKENVFLKNLLISFMRRTANPSPLCRRGMHSWMLR